MDEYVNLAPTVFLAPESQLDHPDESQLADFLGNFSKKSVSIRGRTSTVRVPLLVFFVKVSGS